MNTSSAQVPSLVKVKKQSLLRTKLGLFWKDSSSMREVGAYAGVAFGVGFIVVGLGEAMPWLVKVGGVSVTPGVIWAVRSILSSIRKYLTSLDERARQELQ